MDNGLYNKYKGVKLNDQLVQMFTDLIEEDDVTRKIFIYIGKKMGEARGENSPSKIGATITDMTNDIYITRPVKIRGKSKYKITEAKLDRKRAERAVQSLMLTGLCYYEQVGKTKVIYCTERGIQVLKNIYNREKHKSADYVMN
jgi:predicted transcriptional regulator